MSNNVQIDASEVLAMLGNLSGKQMNQARKMALRKSAKILQKATRRELHGVAKGTNKKHKNKRTGSIWKTMDSGVKATIFKNGDEAHVNIMGEFRLKFFELGTKARFTKGKRKGLFSRGKPAHRGSISAKHFFRKAQQKTERQIFDNMNNELSNSIKKINEKYS